MANIGLATSGAPRGLGDLKRRAIFSGRWEILVIIFGEVGSKLIVFGV